MILFWNIFSIFSLNFCVFHSILLSFIYKLEYFIINYLYKKVQYIIIENKKVNKSMNSRKYLQTQLWANDIRTRDNNRCFVCGSTQQLQVHHIYGVKDYGFLFSDISNGITLCEKCHCKYHQLYPEVNPYTWSQFLLKNEWNASSILISYDNGSKREIALYPSRDEKSSNKPLLNKSIRSTVIHLVQTSGFDNGITPIDWLNLCMDEVYGIGNERTEEEVNYLVKRGIFEKVGKRNVRMDV